MSLKATQEDPWHQFARTHPIGQIVPGRVTKLMPFGAFVRVEEGIEGLAHVSELAERHVEVPEQPDRPSDAGSPMRFYGGPGSVIFVITPRPDRLVVWKEASCRQRSSSPAGA